MGVVVYSTPGCQQCVATKRVLDRRGIEYTPVDLSQDLEALEMVRSRGFSAAPVVQIGEEMFAGFRPDKLAELTPLSRW